MSSYLLPDSTSGWTIGDNFELYFFENILDSSNKHWMGKENTLLPHFGFKSFLFFITNTSAAYGQSLYLWTKAVKAGNPIKTNQHLVNIKLIFLETYFQTNPIWNHQPILLVSLSILFILLKMQHFYSLLFGTFVNDTVMKIKFLVKQIEFHLRCTRLL